jgi:hypothetical protein
MKVKYKNKYLNLKLTSNGFKLNLEGTDRWEYVKREHIIKLCSLLNATFGYKKEFGRLKLNIPIEDREGIPLTKQRAIIWNTAIVINCLYPEFTFLDEGYIVSTNILKTEEYEERLKKMISNEKLEVNVKGEESGEYISLTEFMEE